VAFFSSFPYIELIFLHRYNRRSLSFWSFSGPMSYHLRAPRRPCLPFVGCLPHSHGPYLTIFSPFPPIPQMRFLSLHLCPFLFFLLPLFLFNTASCAFALISDRLSPFPRFAPDKSSSHLMPPPRILSPFCLRVRKESVRRSVHVFKSFAPPSLSL